MGTIVRDGLIFWGSGVDLFPFLLGVLPVGFAASGGSGAAFFFLSFFFFSVGVN